MNLSSPLLAPTRLFHSMAVQGRRLLPRQQSHAFGPSIESEPHRIGRIYVINLDRQPDRWDEVSRELNQVLDSSRAALTKLTVRYHAVDARSFAFAPLEGKEVDPFYTLGDQLFVEPQPRALPDRLELNRPIRMSQPEVAVALSHIGVWRKIAAGEHAYALVLEDDVWFRRGFARHLDRAWVEMGGEGSDAHRFDILYLSYKEVKYGAQKTFLSGSVFRPVRGLWYLSGYVLSRAGAAKLLGLLPCRGPVDLWINHQFGTLDVRATKRSIISQRRDGGSTNSYSILPALTKIGVLDSEGESLFRIRPQERPVFAFGAKGSGLSSLAMALSMLGYRCCSDLQDLPAAELKHLLAGRSDRVFDAYVNIGSLEANARALGERYPQAKFIITTREDGRSDAGTLDIVEGVSGRRVAVLPAEGVNKWKLVCEHLRCPPPVCPFPEIKDVGHRRLLDASVAPSPLEAGKDAKRDSSPWVVESRPGWRGIRSVPASNGSTRIGTDVSFKNQLQNLDTKRWFLRDDTFAGNLALFRPSNVELCAGIGVVLTVKKESLGVRGYSAASISSRDRFLFGRFEADLQASRVPGIVTGFFLHRDSPRQEIDVEIVGSRSNRLLVNVFYNPGGEGANFDYGYRGSPSWIELGFDASESTHRYAVEWRPDQIRWLVDEKLVHERANWDPTPIPQLPMTLHVNTWPSRSTELAGRLANRRLPATAVVRSIAVEASLARS
jgi:GR25 family glycosyltransferase involved in LPS biosynthesis